MAGTPPSSARVAFPSHAFSVLEAALALLRGSENDIGEDNDGGVVAFGVPLTRVPPACLVARDHPAMEVRGAVAVSSSLLPATHVGSRYHLYRRGVELVIICAITFCKPLHYPRCPDRVEPACAWIKILA